MNLFELVAVAIAFASATGCTPAPHERAHSAHDKEEHEEHEHAEAADPRLQDPIVVAAAAKVRVLPGEVECASEVLGLVDVHESVKSTAEGLELLRRRAALIGADAVTGVEFEHGGGGAEKTHLSGTAVRCKDLLGGRSYDVIGNIEASAAMEHEDDALAALKKAATARGANLIIGVHFEHGESDRTKVSGTAVHAYPTVAK